MTERQKAFCDYYVTLQNATQAAIKAGYSKKTAKQIGTENLSKPYLRAYIDEQLKKLEDARIADANEVLKRLTSIMRGEVNTVIPIFIDKGVQELQEVGTPIGEVTKAAQMLGKVHGLFVENINIAQTPTIVDDI